MENFLKQISTESFEKFSKMCHKAAEKNGWWDGVKGNNNWGERLIKEKMALIASEYTEALEADRKGRVLRKDVFSGNADLSDPQVYEQEVKDTVEDELLDAAIRIGDLMCFLMEEAVEEDNGGFFNVAKHLNEDADLDSLPVFPVFTFEVLMVLMSRHPLEFIGSEITVADFISTQVKNVKESFVLTVLCLHHRMGADYDFMKHAKLKLKFNESRGKMHGSKRY